MKKYCLFIYLLSNYFRPFLWPICHEECIVPFLLLRSPNVVAKENLQMKSTDVILMQISYADICFVMFSLLKYYICFCTFKTLICWSGNMLGYCWKYKTMWLVLNYYNCSFCLCKKRSSYMLILHWFHTQSAVNLIPFWQFFVVFLKYSKK